MDHHQLPVPYRTQCHFAVGVHFVNNIETGDQIMMTLKRALLMILFVSATIQVQAEEVLLDSFEGKIEKGTVDFGAAAGSSLEAAGDQAQKACGNQSLKLTYNLATGGYMYSARGFGLDAPQAQWEGPAFDKINWQDFKGISFQMNDE